MSEGSIASSSSSLSRPIIGNRSASKQRCLAINLVITPNGTATLQRNYVTIQPLIEDEKRYVTPSEISLVEEDAMSALKKVFHRREGGYVRDVFTQMLEDY